jgi:hypothetical protein
MKWHGCASGTAVAWSLLVSIAKPIAHSDGQMVWGHLCTNSVDNAVENPSESMLRGSRTAGPITSVTF